MINENMEKILALVKLANNRIEGRTKFQKLVYILKNKGVDFRHKFTYHYFGPYSADLQLEIEELVDQGILIERDSKPYIYQIKDEWIKNINTNILNDKKKLIKYLNSRNYQELELVATIYYLINIGIKNEKIIQSKLKILKPNLYHKISSSFKIYSTLETEYNTTLTVIKKRKVRNKEIAKSN